MAPESSTSTLPLPQKAGASTFATIFAIESFTRSLNVTVVSLQAYDILGSSQKVSVLAASVSLILLLSTLMLPLVLGRLRRRWAYSLGALLMLIASLALASHTLTGQVIGMFLRNGGSAIFHIVLSLYILDNIKRQDLARVEPIRLSMSAISWTAGPGVGVWLYVNYGSWGAQWAVIASLAVLMAVFWYLRLSDSGASLPSGTLQPFNPLANVRRFTSQPRLVLAWFIAFGRSCFWATFMIYGPLLIVESGLGKGMSGLVVSASQALLLAAYWSGSLARRFGVRAVLAGSFVLASVTALGAGFAGTEAPYVAIVFLLAGALAGSALDGVGGIPFLRAVRPHERQRMTAVYRTSIEFSDLIPSFIFAFVLLRFEIGSVFVILGLWLGVMGFLTWRYLPRSL
ncbi:MAG: MFS transporter [Rhizobiales bacterium]|nr:MFS transporter [Hyphomicrobiales bacterium]